MNRPSRYKQIPERPQSFPGQARNLLGGTILVQAFRRRQMLFTDTDTHIWPTKSHPGARVSDTMTVLKRRDICSERLFNAHEANATAQICY